MRVVIDASPQPDGTVTFTVQGPDDPLFTIDILNSGIRLMLAKAVEQRKTAQQINIPDERLSRRLLDNNGVH